jgi:hypothetical protein
MRIVSMQLFRLVTSRFTLSLGLLALITCASSVLHATTGKSFFKPRAVGQEAVLQYSMTQNFNMHNEKAPHFNLSGVGFYQESRQEGKLARYFFPNNKTELVIKGATAGGAAPDISATWLQIAGLDPNTPDLELYLNAFQSTISIKPELKRFGGALQFFKYLGCDKFWFSAFLTVVQVETNAHLRESNITNAVTAPESLALFVIEDNALAEPILRLEPATDATILNATQAFNNPE